MTKLSIFAVTGILLASVANAAGTKLTLGTKGNNLVFDKLKLSAKAGQPVTLIFKNNGTKDGGMQHNWSLVQPGSEQDIATNGMGAGPEKGYLPDSPNIIAHTKLLNAGESETITFTAPSKAGDYPYICTFPGHFPAMKGVLTVK